MWTKVRRFFHEWNLPQTLAIGIFEHREKLERNSVVKQPRQVSTYKDKTKMNSKFNFQEQHPSSRRIHRQTRKFW